MKKVKDSSARLWNEVLRDIDQLIEAVDNGIESREFAAEVQFLDRVWKSSERSVPGKVKRQLARLVFQVVLRQSKLTGTDRYLCSHSLAWANRVWRHECDRAVAQIAALSAIGTHLLYIQDPDWRESSNPVPSIKELCKWIDRTFHIETDAKLLSFVLSMSVDIASAHVQRLSAYNPDAKQLLSWYDRRWVDVQIAVSENDAAKLTAQLAALAQILSCLTASGRVRHELFRATVLWANRFRRHALLPDSRKSKPLPTVPSTDRSSIRFRRGIRREQSFLLGQEPIRLLTLAASAAAHAWRDISEATNTNDLTDIGPFRQLEERVVSLAESTVDQVCGCRQPVPPDVAEAAFYSRMWATDAWLERRQNDEMAAIVAETAAWSTLVASLSFRHGAEVERTFLLEATAWCHRVWSCESVADDRRVSAVYCSSRTLLYLTCPIITPRFEDRVIHYNGAKFWLARARQQAVVASPDRIAILLSLAQLFVRYAQDSISFGLSSWQDHADLALSTLEVVSEESNLKRTSILSKEVLKDILSTYARITVLYSLNGRYGQANKSIQRSARVARMYGLEGANWHLMAARVLDALEDSVGIEASEDQYWALCSTIDDLEDAGSVIREIKTMDLRRAVAPLRLASAELLARCISRNVASHRLKAEFEKCVDGVPEWISSADSSAFRVRAFLSLRNLRSTSVTRALEEAELVPSEQSFCKLVERILMATSVSDLTLRMQLALPLRKNLELFENPAALLSHVLHVSYERLVVLFFDTGRTMLRVSVSRGVPCVVGIDRNKAVELCEAFDRQVKVLMARGFGASVRDRAYNTDLVDIMRGVGELFFFGLSREPALVIPHSFCHDAIGPAIGALADRNSINKSVDQIPSVVGHVILSSQYAARQQSASSDVLYVVAGDIDPYKTVVEETEDMVAKFGRVWKYEADRLASGKLITRLVGPTGKEYRSSRGVHPRVIFWLIHGSFDAGARGLGGLRYQLVASEDTDADVRVTDFSQRISLPLPRGTLRVHLSQTVLVLSGACASGRVISRLGEEAAGLMRGFLAAGIPTVVAAAWPVPVGTSAARGAVTTWRVLIERLCAGESIAEAVCSARRGCASELSGLYPRIVESGYLTIHGLGSASSPWMCLDSTHGVASSRSETPS